MVTFGGRFRAEDASGWIAKAMAKGEVLGDWRRLDHAEAWANTIAGELASGSSMLDRDRWAAFIAPFIVLPLTEDVTWLRPTVALKC